MKKKPRIGRPPKPPGEKYRTPVRQLGRVTDADWQLMTAAAEARGETFTAWATGVLLRAAKRELK